MELCVQEGVIATLCMVPTLETRGHQSPTGLLSNTSLFLLTAEDLACAGTGWREQTELQLPWLSGERFVRVTEASRLNL